MANILIVEDDVALATTTQKWLELQQHRVDVASTGTEGWDMLEAFGYDVLVLDWDLPSIAGIEILRRLRYKNHSLPVLMLTGKDQLDDKEQAFEAGADDYLTKPFHPRELSLRLKALLRRPHIVQQSLLQVKDVQLDPAVRKVNRGGVEIPLQPLEFDLLEFFMRHPNQVFSMEALLQRVWGHDADVSMEAVYTCIKRIRKKLDRKDEQSLIRNVFGAGYCLDQ